MTWSAVLAQELTCWAEAGTTATFWLRDDDACAVTAPFFRLQRLLEDAEIYAGIAVIPSTLQQDLAAALSTTSWLAPMCHGWAHIDHGGREGPCEFPEARRREFLERDLRQAQAVFKSHFPNDVCVFVPPFNRIERAARAMLAPIGFEALSGSASVTERRAARVLAQLPWLPRLPHLPSPGGLPCVDAQCDLIDWAKGTAVAEDALARNLVGHLRLRRSGLIPRHTPIGLLTHHLVHDEPVWTLLARTLDFLKAQPAVRFVPLAALVRVASERENPRRQGK